MTDETTDSEVIECPECDGEHVQMVLWDDHRLYEVEIV